MRLDLSDSCGGKGARNSLATPGVLCEHLPVIEFRDAAAGDALAVATVQVASWREAYRDQLPAEYLAELSVPDRDRFWAQVVTEPPPRTGIVLALRDETVVGFAAYGPATDTDDPALGQLFAIYLDPACWDTGIGRQLHAIVLDRLRAHGFTGAVLWMLDGNVRAARFYRLAGWDDPGRTMMERFGDVERALRQLSRDL